jgi:uroporphyrin-III C-methyltransferase/precorrin-2 dehydrogenase/sirohydrochlorin ferrochelatase
MAYYPLFVDLADRACLVVGGGAIAEGKVHGLLAAGAHVTVVSPTLIAPLADTARAGRIDHRPRTYRDGDLAGFVLAFTATGDPTVNDAVAAEGRRCGVWVNAVDDPAHCDFIVPAVLRRGALTVAVSTGGASPAFARAVREELEQHFGDDYAMLLDVAGEVRRELRIWHRRPDAHAWQDALNDPGFRRLVTEGRREAARRRLHARLEEAVSWSLERDGGSADAALPEGAWGTSRWSPMYAIRSEPPRSGRVLLVGAGPGDPGLLTVRGRDALAAADVVVYDRLVGDALLDLAPPSALRIFAGKTRGDHTMPQSAINAVLVHHARQGRLVVRLKGGDPFVFGRGGEEAEALAAAGIPFEVVPGVSAAVAVPAYAGIPVTHRRLSSSFAVVTGHDDPDKSRAPVDWAGLATAVDTLVVLMGQARLEHIARELIAHGRASDTPVALISAGTTAAQRVVECRLEEAGDVARDLPAPLLVVIGEVVSLRERLQWLAGAATFDGHGPSRSRVGAVAASL